MKRIASIFFILFASLLLTSAKAKQQARPKLVLQIVVDQLRGR
jgi:hypothetical protein